MSITLKDGFVLTDEMIEEIADKAERGELPGKPGRFIIAPPGRPRLSDEELVTIAFKVPASRRDQIDAAAASKGQTRSEFLRDVLEQALTAEQPPVTATPGLSPVPA